VKNCIFIPNPYNQLAMYK